eukprot:4288509-Amphidinium_carterae.1
MSAGLDTIKALGYSSQLGIVSAHEAKHPHFCSSGPLRSKLLLIKRDADSVDERFSASVVAHSSIELGKSSLKQTVSIPSQEFKRPPGAAGGVAAQGSVLRLYESADHTRLR